jgi:DNA mismatch repair protein MLH1
MQIRSTKNIDSFSQPLFPTISNLGNSSVLTVQASLNNAIPLKQTQTDILDLSEPNKEVTKKWTEVRLTSILHLIESLRKNSHDGLTDIFRDHTFIGCVNNSIALIQHKTQLLMVNYNHLSEHLCYQIALLGFHNFGIIHFKEQLDVRELCLISIESSAGWDSTSMLKKEDIANVSIFFYLRKLQSY